MADNRRSVLVTGATGTQGGAVARELLRRDFRVRGLTRNRSGDAAQALAAEGAEMVEGDMASPADLDRAIDGVWGVFSVQNFWEAGFDDEVAQGRNVADAAASAGVGHLVYSSVASAWNDTGLAHFESKWQIENHIRDLGLPYTILRPVFFMQNLEMMRETLQGGTLPQPLPADRRLQMVSADDIGVFAGLAFSGPDEFRGRELDLAGDEPTMQEVADTFSTVAGRSVEYVQVPWGRFEEQMGAEMTRMYRWFDDVGYEADIEALRRLHPGLVRLEEYLRAAGWGEAIRGE